MVHCIYAYHWQRLCGISGRRRGLFPEVALPYGIQIEESIPAAAGS